MYFLHFSCSLAPGLRRFWCYGPASVEGTAFNMEGHRPLAAAAMRGVWGRAARNFSAFPRVSLDETCMPFPPMPLARPAAVKQSRARAAMSIALSSRQHKRACRYYANRPAEQVFATVFSLSLWPSFQQMITIIYILEQEQFQM